MSIEGSYLDCFRGDSLRRTEIAMVSWGCQILPGFAIQNYITYFFTLAGLDSSDSFNLSIGECGFGSHVITLTRDTFQAMLALRS